MLCPFYIRLSNIYELLWIFLHKFPAPIFRFVSGDSFLFVVLRIGFSLAVVSGNGVGFITISNSGFQRVD